MSLQYNDNTFEGGIKDCFFCNAFPKIPIPYENTWRHFALYFFLHIFIPMKYNKEKYITGK